MSEYNENNFSPEQPKQNPPEPPISHNDGEIYRRTPMEASQPPVDPQQPQQPPQQPQQPQQQGYYTYDNQSEPQQPPQPQQYSPSNGWQQPGGGYGSTPPPPPKEPYQWRMSDYETAGAVKPRRRGKGILVFSIIFCSVLVVSLVSFAGVGVYNTFMKTGDAPQSEQPSVNVPVGDLPSISLQDKPQGGDISYSTDGRFSTEQIVEKVAPSIVAITTYANTGYNGYQAEGMGSGIIIREDGYIVTNAHVIEGAQGLTVTLNDGETKYEGRVIGSDTKTDLAVIKVDATGLPAAVFGNSDQTKVGEKVIAIGNPQSMDFSGSVTQGIVSGLNRTLTASGGATGTSTTYANLIQTDAAINPGNSGGALVNEFGQIIGINSAKVVATGAEGMGFAIPSNEAKPIVDDLIANGRVTGRVMLGITASVVDEVLGRLNNWPTGILVQSTQADSDISKKGVTPGDIITKAEGQELNSFSSLTLALKDKKPGDSVELEVYRPASRQGQNGKFYTITVKLMEDMGEAVPTETPQSDQQIPGYEEYPGYDQYPGYGESPDYGQYPDYGQSPEYNDYYDFFNDFFG